MSVATKNMFALLDAEGDSRPSTPAPKPAAKPAPTPAPAPAAQAPRANNTRGRGGPRANYPRRGGATKTAPKEGEDAAEPTEPRKRFDGERGGRGRGRGRGAPRGGNRPFDRHSQTGKVDTEKKVNQGWGAEEGAAELNAEEGGKNDAVAEAKEGSETPAEDKEKSERRREREPEEEDNNLTYEQYLASQKEKESVVPKLEGVRSVDAEAFKDAVAVDKSETDYFAGKTKASRARGEKKEKILIDIDARFAPPARGGRGRGERGGDRNDRPARGGRGRGNRGNAPKASAGPTIDVSDNTAFPSLS